MHRNETRYLKGCFVRTFSSHALPLLLPLPPPSKRPPLEFGKSASTRHLLHAARIARGEFSRGGGGALQLKKYKRIQTNHTKLVRVAKSRVHG